MSRSSFFLPAIAGLLCFVPLTGAMAAADAIWHGGPVITMNDAAMSAEAVAIEDGVIVAVGDEAEVLKRRGRKTRVIDLDGHALLPGFFDAHGHVYFGGLQAQSANLLAPPDGDVTDLASLKQSIRDWIDTDPDLFNASGLVIGFGYDNATLAERRHPTRDDLDEISTELPIYLVHQSGHFGAANSPALELAGFSADSPDPAGGIIRRQADGAPDGVLEENAHFAALAALFGKLDSAAMVGMVQSGVELWASYGYTTAQEGRTTADVVGLLQSVGAAGGLPIDVVAYVDVLVDREYARAQVSSDYENRFRVGGVKLTIDGSPQGFTAWRDRPYYAPVGNYPPAYAGYAAATPVQVIEAIDWAFEHDLQILTHSNGEAASDLLLAAIDSAGRRHGNDDRRAVLIHGQFLREDQVAALDRMDVFPSLFPMHTFYWGDWHREQTVGPVNADDISPTGWLRSRGMKFSSHHDAPVAFPNSMRVLDATVTRRTRSGDILGPDQRVDVETALKAMTLWPAYQHFEEHRKGSIEVGKLADFVVLSADPTDVDPESLDQIEVLETIKEGKTIYSKP